MSERYLLKSRQPDADFEHRLVSADGEFEFYFRCSESAAHELVEHLDSLHERIAAALNAQAGVVEALRPLEEALARHDKAALADDHGKIAVAAHDLFDAARAALAAIKGEKP